jgi:hypothetical protein
MNKLFAAAFVALPLLALPAQAETWTCGPFSVDAGFNYHLNVICNGHQVGGSSSCPSCADYGPWYLYWPYEAHLQTQAPMPFPYWPSAQTAPSAPIRPEKASASAKSAYQTVGYYYYPRTTPNYWYGR